METTESSRRRKEDDGPASVPPHRPVTEYRAMPRNLPDREPFASLSPNGKLLDLMIRLTLGPSGLELIPPKRFAATFEERTRLAPAAVKRAIRELRRAKCRRPHDERHLQSCAPRLCAPGRRCLGSIPRPRIVTGRTAGNRTTVGYGLPHLYRQAM